MDATQKLELAVDLLNLSELKFHECVGGYPGSAYVFPEVPDYVFMVSLDDNREADLEIYKNSDLIECIDEVLSIWKEEFPSAPFPAKPSENIDVLDMFREVIN